MADFDLDSVLNQIVGKAAGNSDFLNQLQNEPAKALENMTGIDLPDEQIDAVVKKMGGITGLVEAYNNGGADNVIKEAAVAGAESALGGSKESDSTDTSDSSGSIVGDLLESVMGSSSESTSDKKSSSKKKKSSDEGENIAGEILGDILGSK